MIDELEDFLPLIQKPHSLNAGVSEKDVFVVIGDENFLQFWKR